LTAEHFIFHVTYDLPSDITRLSCHINYRQDSVSDKSFFY